MQWWQDNYIYIVIFINEFSVHLNWFRFWSMLISYTYVEDRTISLRVRVKFAMNDGKTSREIRNEMLIAVPGWFTSNLLCLIPGNNAVSLLSHVLALRIMRKIGIITWGVNLVKFIVAIQQQISTATKYSKTFYYIKYQSAERSLKSRGPHSVMSVKRIRIQTQSAKCTSKTKPIITL